MTFPGAVRSCLSQYFTFSGRASRAEYWYFVLFLFLGLLAAGFLDELLFDAVEIEASGGAIDAQSNGPIAATFSLVTLIPGLAAGWRRMHDTGKSGLFVLYPLIVMIGIFGFMHLAAGLGSFTQGDLAATFTGGVGIVLFIAFIVLIISPLLVIWWLTRPSSPHSNAWGPPPPGAT
ncbi:DUF805 domain-containing protein [Mesobaculum littorinae]|uniref:DUF805 domain-containing protein n=1 Tax=Mesobaculum littorinae TaxID=2486419 RepID=A0A438AD71_9RHOB|nr:DUF805 domain-containing protein [Mesobaculum littorinae]RVV96629.1 DUF805 domain-containing protein [Mesobaculum littorinae]